MSTAIKLDDTDIRILRMLQANSNLTIKELAQKVNLTPTPTFERVRRLENEGIIKQYIAVLDADKIGHGFSVFCAVKLKSLNQQYVHEFTEKIKEIPEVTECYNISGEYDYMLRIMSPDMKAYQHFLLNELGPMECLSSLTSMFVMDEIKHNYSYLI